MIDVQPPWDARVASAEDELRYEYRRAVDALETLRAFSATRDRGCDEEIDWAPVADLQGRLRELAEEITRQPAEVPA